jgi:hypothetical protein
VGVDFVSFKGKPKRSNARAPAVGIPCGKWRGLNGNLCSSIANAFHARMLRAMSTAIDDTSSFDAVPNNMALAVRASWRHGVNGTFEAVECHGLSR